METSIRRAQTFHGDEGFAVQRGDKLNTGIDGATPHPIIVQVCHHNRTGAAVALGTTLFGAGAAQALTQIGQNRQGGIDLPQLDDLPV